MYIVSRAAKTALVRFAERIVIDTYPPSGANELAIRPVVARARLETLTMVSGRRHGG